MDQDEVGLTNLVAEAAGVEIPKQDDTTQADKTNTATQTATDAPAPAATTEPAKAETEATDNTNTTQTDTKTEPSQTNTNTDTQTEVPDWKANLPKPPVLAQLIAPTLDDNGQITNMDPQQYEEYIKQSAANAYKEQAYQDRVENAALDAAEQVLPEIKTNPTIRQLVENQRIAQVVNGQDGDVVAAAQAIKQLLGDSVAKGAQNAKTSITIQKNAAVETGASAKPEEAEKGAKLAKRINANDPDAFIELLDLWQEKGIV